MPELPEHWTTTQLDLLISRIEAGLNVKCEERPPEKNEKGLVKISAVTWGRFDENQSKTLPTAENPKTEALISSGDLLFSRANTIELVGASVIVGAISRQLYLSDKVLRLVIENEETKKWINYALKTAETRKKIESASSGNQLSMRNIGQEKLKAIEIPLAPLAEQKQIAAKLDELLAQVDTLKARLDAIPTILKRFRQSVLAAAVSGRLTDGWRGTKAVAFGRSPITINQEFTDAPKNWDWRKLTDLAQLESGHTPRKSVPEYWDNGDTYWISLQDIRAAHGKTITDTKYKTTSLGIKNSSARILPTGTVCFSRDISVGYTTIMGYDMSTTQHFANWICGAKLNNKYLMYSFMAAREHLTISGQGTTVKTIYMPALKELFILTPGVEEQTEIVLRVEQLFAFADQIEQRVRDAQARVNLLTQSILAKAFRGELTADWCAQNVDLISGDNAAEALLARIRAARAEQPKGKRGRRAAGQ